MPIKINNRLTPKALLPKVERLFELSGKKILKLEKDWNPADGTPVFTEKGRYTTRGWTEWTQGFQFGSAVLQFDATGDEQFLEIGRNKTVELMATHVSHIGVHDHGFNNVSTYGNLLRLMREERIPWNEREKDFYEIALKVSGAVQAARWTPIAGGKGFIHSFNGPHSLFIDTIRSVRALMVAHRLGHVLMGERDSKISLLRRGIEHAEATAKYNVYYGAGRDGYDVWGRTSHESIFNCANGDYRCPSTQQGYSAFSTWTRGLAWALCGYPEELEFLETLPKSEVKQAFANAQVDFPAKNFPLPKGVSLKGFSDIEKLFLLPALATADFIIEHSCADGIPIWDTGAPEAHRLGDYTKKVSNPYNAWEPMDSSAAAIAAQGLIRLGNWLERRSELKDLAKKYRQAGLTMASALFEEPYLSTDAKHHGLILHSIYHRPNGWDYTPKGQKIPCGESSMWGDYHARELALLIQREAKGEPYLTFFGCCG